MQCSEFLALTSKPDFMMTWVDEAFTCSVTQPVIRCQMNSFATRKWGSSVDNSATFSANRASGNPPRHQNSRIAEWKMQKNKCNTYCEEMSYLCGKEREGNCCWVCWRELKDANARVSTSQTCGLSGEPVFISQEFCTIKRHRGALCSTDILVKAVWYSVHWDSSISTRVRCQFPSDGNICEVQLVTRLIWISAHVSVWDGCWQFVLTASNIWMLRRSCGRRMWTWLRLLVGSGWLTATRTWFSADWLN